MLSVSSIVIMDTFRSLGHVSSANSKKKINPDANRNSNVNSNGNVIVRTCTVFGLINLKIWTTQVAKPIAINRKQEEKTFKVVNCRDKI